MSLPKILSITTAALLVVAGGVYWGWGKSENYSEFPEQLSQDPSQIFTSSAISESDIVNWKIYTNQEYNFEFKYPSDWFLTIQTPGPGPSLSLSLEDQHIQNKRKNISDGTDLPSSMTLDVYGDVSKLDYEKLGVKDLNDYIYTYASLSDPIIEQITKVKIGKAEGYRVVVNRFAGGISYYTQIGSGIYEFWFFDASTSYSPQLALQILSTFKFGK